MTHDQAEAFAVADRAVVMNAGLIEQIGSPEAIYCCPATPFVAHFLGLTNIAHGQITGPGQVASAWGELTADTGNHQSGDQVDVLIRPEAARLVIDNALATSENTVRGQVSERSFRGGRYRVKIRPELGPILTFEFTTVGKLSAAPGDEVAVFLDPAGVVVLPKPD